MVLDPHRAVADDPDGAPRMLGRPSDPPPALGHMGDDESLRSLRALMEARRTRRPASLRAWAARVSGRSDRRLLDAVAHGTAAVATHCDLLVDRLAAQEAVTADVAGAFGEEITRLRAEVIHLQRLVTSLQGPPRG
jgi:hypothetical protein